ncbi:hypothetical protein BGX27_001159 [Mortierella sp. AM989]|nr:hypothetical protein BGX27_001159 [Mortierella sp. AM989]
MEYPEKRDWPDGSHSDDDNHSDDGNHSDDDSHSDDGNHSDNGSHSDDDHWGRRRWRNRNDWDTDCDTVSPSPATSTTTSISSDPPSLTPTPAITFNRKDTSSLQGKPGSVPLIVGVCAGALFIIAGAIVLCCFFQRRKHRQILSQSKTIPMSPQDTPQPPQFIHDIECQQNPRSDLDYESAEKKDHGAHSIPDPTLSSPTMSYVIERSSAAGVQPSDYYSSLSFPIQLSTPRDREIGSNICPLVGDSLESESTSHLSLQNMHEAISHSKKPSLSVSTLPLQHHNYTNTVAQQDQRGDSTKISSQRASNDFYVDMLSLVADAPGVSNPAKRRSTSLSTPLPARRSISRPTSFVHQIPTRSRSPSSASMKSPTTGETGGATPRVSRESRRQMYNYPPPPPPPSVPPPAIPAEVAYGFNGTRSGRPRACTMTSVGRKSEKNLVFQSPGVSSSQGSSEPFHHRQRSQGNAQVTDEFTAALDQFFPALPLPASLASKNCDAQLTNLHIDATLRSSGSAMRPTLRQYHSHHGTTGGGLKSTES